MSDQVVSGESFPSQNPIKRRRPLRKRGDHDSPAKEDYDENLSDSSCSTSSSSSSSCQGAVYDTAAARVLNPLEAPTHHLSSIKGKAATIMERVLDGRPEFPQEMTEYGENHPYSKPDVHFAGRREVAPIQQKHASPRSDGKGMEKQDIGGQAVEITALDEGLLIWCIFSYGTL